MSMNKATGNMYPFVSHTWNPIKGKCSHECSYCFYQANPRYKDKIGKLRLDEKCFKDNLALGEFIFVGSSTDMFADQVHGVWIGEVLNYCRKFNTKYLFQTKNPERFSCPEFLFPENTVLGTTIETNRSSYAYDKTNAPNVKDRFFWMLHNSKKENIETMISIEPIMDFDVNIFVSWIQAIKPIFVSIGADSKGHNLPEPSPEKVRELIKELKKFTKVYEKDNLKRLL